MRIAILLGGLVLLIGMACGGSRSDGPPAKTSSQLEATAATYVEADPEISTSVPTKPPGITAMKMLTETAGWVVKDNRLLMTRDSGQTWSDVSPPLFDKRSHTFFLDELHGWVVQTETPPDQEAGPVIITTHRTEDGGETWESSAFEAGRLPASRPPTFSAQDIEFFDPAHGWLQASSRSGNLGDAVFYRTEDGGATWNRLTGTPHCGFGVMAWSVRPTSVWVTCLASATLWITTDNGRTWNDYIPLAGLPERSECPSIRDLIHFVGRLDGQIGVVAGKTECSVRALILSTRDGGAVWRRVSTPNDLMDMDIVSSIDWLGRDRNDLYRTENASETWQIVGDSWRDAVTESDEPALKSYDFATPDAGWILVETNDESHVLLATGDGGKTWRELNP